MSIAINRLERVGTSLLLATVLSLIFGCEASLMNNETGTWQQEPANIEVVVVDENGNPIADASVILYEQVVDGAQLLERGTTDSSGTKIFFEPIPGEYLVHVRKDGYVGRSGFATVSSTSSTIGGFQLLPISSIPDVAYVTIGSAGGTVETQATHSLPQTTVTFSAGDVASGVEITVGTLTGTQIPTVPPGQVSLNSVLVDATGDLTGSATIEIGLPFDLPVGTMVPISSYNELTGGWEVISSGEVQGSDGRLLAEIPDIGTLSALAAFVPRRAARQQSQVGQSRLLSPSDPPVISETYVPTLSYPSGTNYTTRTREWLKGVIGGLIGVTFGEPLTISITRDPSITQEYTLLSIVDEYIITVDLSAGTKLGRIAEGDQKHEFQGNANTQTQNTTAVVHQSGNGGTGE